MNLSRGKTKFVLLFALGLLGALVFINYSYAFRNPTAAPPTGGTVISIDASAPNNSISIGSTGAITGGTWQGSVIGIPYGGTGATTATGAVNSLLPSQALQGGKFLTTDGTNVSWGASSAGVTSISAGTGITLSPNPISSTGTVTNAGVVSISCSSPLSCSGTNPASFSITQATSTVSGYLSSTDWNTFNNKLSSSDDYGRSGVSDTLCESATPLSSKYLGIFAKAADANLLDGLDSTDFLSTSSDWGRFNVTGTLYEGTTNLSSKYVQKSGDTMTGTLYAPELRDYNNSTYYVDPSQPAGFYAAYLNGSVGARNYYDLDNTAYYVDPAGTSNLSTLCLAGTCRTTWPSLVEADTLETVASRGQSTQYWLYSPKFVDYNNNSYYVDPNSASYLSVLQLGTPIVSPAVPLYVNGGAYVGGVLDVNSYMYTTALYDKNNSSWYVDPSYTGYSVYVAGYGSAIRWDDRSSKRWKENIQPIDNALSKITSLTGVYFDWKEEQGGKHDVGMIAEDVGRIIPEVVTYAENGVDAEGMSYGRLTAVLVEAVKEQQKQIENLKSRIEELENK